MRKYMNTMLVVVITLLTLVALAGVKQEVGTSSRNAVEELGSKAYSSEDATWGRFVFDY